MLQPNNPLKDTLQIYADDMRHLVCMPYNEHNLHAMAAWLGIKRCWFHKGRWPHYDIPKCRVAEINILAQHVTPKQILRICKGGLP